GCRALCTDKPAGAMGTLACSPQATLSRRFLPYLLQPYLPLRSRVPDSRLTPNGRRCRHRAAHRGGGVLSQICGDAPMIFTSSTPPLQHLPNVSHQSIPAKNTVKLLGCPVAAPSLEFPLFEQDYREAAELLHRLPSTGGPRIGLHTGARVPARRWPEAYFASLADELARRYNAQILLTGAANESET